MMMMVYSILNLYVVHTHLCFPCVCVRFRDYIVLLLGIAHPTLNLMSIKHRQQACPVHSSLWVGEMPLGGR